MQSGHILDSQITSSSSYNDLTLGPTSSRIRTEKNGGAWCPKQQITSNIYEYLQINLKSLHVITMIETQGRFGNGQGIELTEQYRIEYTRDKLNNHTKWIKFIDRDNNQVCKIFTNF
jgi:discoidin domain receptor family protein 2